MNRSTFAAAAALLLLAACGRGAETKDGLTQKEREGVDNAAAMLDDNQIFDTSPDSLVPDNAAAPAAAAPANGTAPSANAAAPAPTANQAAPRR